MNSKPKNIWSSRITYIILGWLLILGAIACDVGITVPRYEIFTDKVSRDVRIVLLTDFHSSSYGDGGQVIIDAVDRQRPDVILLGGDIFEDVRPHENSTRLLLRLREKYPCYYVAGNHEEWSGEMDGIKDIVRSCGVTVLEGGYADFGEVRICGADNSLPANQYTNCVDAAGEKFTVLMSHRPDLVKLYSGKGFDLVVCGHAHGGQVIIPGIVNGLYAPNQGIFPEYAGGRYTLEDGSTEMIVSRGLCKNILPRVFNQPEVVVIEIRNS
ncbi:MAG: metallophosphoesterase [Oscillospiraceae bacterium]|nr:metallophosphoesterase [Oscillospiraceae bacterium]